MISLRRFAVGKVGSLRHNKPSKERNSIRRSHIRHKRFFSDRPTSGSNANLEPASEVPRRPRAGCLVAGRTSCPSRSQGKTNGYAHHPQLIRFQEQSFPVGFVAEYLRVVHREAVIRGYRFAAERISRSRASGHLAVSDGQLAFEWHHLMEKLRTRDPRWRAVLEKVKRPQPHPLFRQCCGDLAEWEKGVLLAPSRCISSITEKHAEKVVDHARKGGLPHPPN